jgi:hypothetical protein
MWLCAQSDNIVLEVHKIHAYGIAATITRVASAVTMVSRPSFMSLTSEEGFSGRLQRLGTAPTHGAWSILNFVWCMGYTLADLAS